MDRVEFTKSRIPGDEFFYVTERETNRSILVLGEYGGSIFCLFYVCTCIHLFLLFYFLKAFLFLSDFLIYIWINRLRIDWNGLSWLYSSHIHTFQPYFQTHLVHLEPHDFTKSDSFNLNLTKWSPSRIKIFE